MVDAAGLQLQPASLHVARNYVFPAEMCAFNKKVPTVARVLQVLW